MRDLTGLAHGRLPERYRLREAHQTSTTGEMRPLGKFQLLERVGLGAFGAVVVYQQGPRTNALYYAISAAQWYVIYSTY
jgi:hypothetical protein